MRIAQPGPLGQTNMSASRRWLLPAAGLTLSFAQFAAAMSTAALLSQETISGDEVHVLLRPRGAAPAGFRLARDGSPS
jgi:hypothetical protein